MHRLTILLAATLLFACSKSDPPASGDSPAPSASPPKTSLLTDDTPPATSASAAPSASAAADTTAAKADAGGAVAATASAAAAPECGKKPLPDCPLQAWMKSNCNPPVMTGDLPKMAAALDKVVGFAPAGYPNWASIAKDGSAAAKSGDLAAAKAACRTCHDQYKDKYKKEMRARKI